MNDMQKLWVLFGCIGSFLIGIGLSTFVINAESEREVSPKSEIIQYDWIEIVPPPNVAATTHCYMARYVTGSMVCVETF